MTSTNDIFYVILLSGFTVISEIALLIIWDYHKTRPLGMQTLLGSVTLMFVKTSSCVFIGLNSLLCIPAILGPFSRSMSMTISILDNLLLWSFFLNLLILLATKYVSIYHATSVSELNEGQILTSLNLIIIVLPVILAILEFAYVSNIDDMTLFQLNYLGQPTANSKIERTSASLVFLNFSIMLILQLRIEIDNSRIQDVEGGLVSRIVLVLRSTNSNAVNVSNLLQNYSIQSARRVVLFSMVIFLMVIKRIIGDDGNGSSVRWIQLTGLGIIEVAVPWLFILNHQSMKTSIGSVLKKRFCIYF